MDGGVCGWWVEGRGLNWWMGGGVDWEMVDDRLGDGWTGGGWMGDGWMGWWIEERKEPKKVRNLDQNDSDWEGRRRGTRRGEREAPWVGGDSEEAQSRVGRPAPRVVSGGLCLL